MASELSNDVKIIHEKVNATLQSETKKEQLSPVKLSGQQKTKALRKSASPNPNKRVTLQTASSQKENLVVEKNKIQKQGRPSKKNEKESIEVSNSKAKTSKKNSISPNAKNKSASSGRKSAAKGVLSPLEVKSKKTEKESIPKIVIYRDDSSKVKAQEKQKKEDSVKMSTKPSSVTNVTNRKSRSETVGNKKGPKLSVSETKKGRNSLKDISNVKTPNKKNASKSVTETKKSPVKSKPRLSKIKPGDAEFEQMFSKLETLFPNIDPEFMKSQFVKMKGSLSETIEFLIAKEKTDDVPTRNDYLRRIETQKIYNKFMENFSVESFLKMIPDPWKHFLEIEKHNCVNYIGHSLHYLKNKYKKHYLQTIQKALTKNGYSLYLANKDLKKNGILRMRITNRSKYECDAGKPTYCDIQFIHEVAFIENESKIKSYIKKAETARRKKFIETQEDGTFLQCQSCTNFNLLREDVINCPANHVFCKKCVVKHIEIEMAEDNVEFNCLFRCGKKFGNEEFQAFLGPSMVAGIIKRSQLNEIKPEGIDDLICCPFCYTLTVIPPPEGSLFKCLNPSCMLEICRNCGELNHFPMKCYEVKKFNNSHLEIEVEMEKEDEVEEDEEEPLFTCNQCNGEFPLKDDSNTLACPCGATICSICRQPLPDCEHSSFEIVSKSSQDLSLSSNETEFPDGDGIAEESGFDKSSSTSERYPDILPSDSDSF